MMKLLLTLCAFLTLIGVTVAQPMMQGGGGGDVKADKAQLAKFQKAYDASKASYAKKPKDAAAKKSYIAATNRLATASMTSLSLSPREKYPVALRLYREVLKVDPKNKEAKNNSEMIVGIYKSMGRPVPKG